MLAGAAIGVVLAALALLWTDGARNGGGPQVEQRPRLLPEAHAALAHVLLHWVPALAPIVEEAYGDFLAALEPDVEVTFLVPEPFSAAQRAALGAFLKRVDPEGGLGKRARIVGVPGPITTWSKDRALVTAPDSKGLIHLVAPAEPSRAWRERHGDWATVVRFARTDSARFHADVAPFDFDAGDFAVAGDTVLVDTNLLEKNRHRGYLNLEQLTARLGEYLQMRVVGLGERFGDTPRHHLAMSMAPLDDRRVLVGDPRLAAGLVEEGWRPGEVSAETGEPLVADFSESTAARFEREADALEARGFRVVRIPNVPFDDKTYVTYTNGIYEVRSGRKRVYMPVYGVEALDDAARAIYEKLGWTVIPVRVRRLYAYHGTIGCVVNVLRRRKVP